MPATEAQSTTAARALAIIGAGTPRQMIQFALRIEFRTKGWQPRFLLAGCVLTDTRDPALARLNCCFTMRRTIALTLMVVFSWTLIAPVFGPGAEANLPPCCRRNGKHHCMMRMMERLSGNQKGFTSVSEKCPCSPDSTCAVHSPTYKPEAGQHFFAEVVRHPACAPQADAHYRICFLRSHQKRGPPDPLA